MKHQNYEDDFLIDYAFIEHPLSFEKANLFQVGKKFCNPITVVYPHAHINWFELTVVLEGEGEIYANGTFIKASAGDIFLSYPCDIHKIVSCPEAPLKYAFISFSFNDETLKSQFEKIMQNFYECEKRLFKNSNISALIDIIIAEMSTAEFMKNDLINAAISQIAIFTAREFLHNRAKSIPNHASKNELLCFKIMRYIDNNVYSIQSLTEVADFFHYNYTYIAKVFAKTTGETMKQYLSTQKLKRAKVLINSDNLSLTEIATLLNYASIYSFSKSFKFHFGISPSDYKKNNAKNQ